MAAQDRQSKRSVVLKTFSKARMSSSLRARLENEVKHLRALAGVPGVVHMVSQTEDEDSVYIVLERVTGGSRRRSATTRNVHLRKPLELHAPPQFHSAADASTTALATRFLWGRLLPCSRPLCPTQTTALEPPFACLNPSSQTLSTLFPALPCPPSTSRRRHGD